MFLKSSIKFFFYLGLLTTNSIVNAKTDCDTLTTLLTSFGISDITWKENSDECCNIAGITCENQRITKIDTDNNECPYKGKLGGKIANEVGDLTELTVLDLRFNKISGTIPDTIASNKKLEVFNIGQNLNISGKLPKAFCSLTNLKELYVYENKLSGSIPSCIGDLTKLTQLCLDSNEFTGNIPSSIGKLTNLVKLDLEKNQLSGTIPESFNELVNLKEFNTDGNKDIIGQIPEIENIEKCNHSETGLCYKEGSKTCIEKLPQCTDDDYKKMEEFNKSKANSPDDDDDDDKDNQNGNDEKNNGGSNIGIIILIIALVIIAIISVFFLFKYCGILACLTKKGKNKKDSELYIPESMENIINDDYKTKEKSFVVLSPKQQPKEEPPQLTLDESAFNYYDVSPRMKEKHESNTSFGINQEQYEKQLQYQNLINNQNYYLS